MGDYEQQLDQIITEIADGNRVDLAGEIQSTDDAGRRGMLEGLQMLADLSCYQSTLRRTDSTEAAALAVTSDGQGEVDGWGSLQITRLVGSGAYGQIYECWDLELQRKVALKIMHASRRDLGSSDQQMIDEGRVVARVRHPNVVQIYGIASREGRRGLWMEFIEGRTLSELIATQGGLSWRETGALGIDLCSGLAAVHAEGLVHRDIKSANVMREAGGRVVLMDFGTGKDTTAAALDMPCGTPLYMAPEVLSGGGATAKSDVYGVGVVLFELLTGRCPVVVDSFEALRRAHADGERDSLAQLRPEIPAQFVSVVERATALDPNDRFSSATELRDALTQALASEGPQTQTAPSVSEPRRRAVLLGVGSVALFIAAWGMWPRSDRADGLAGTVQLVIDPLGEGRVLDDGEEVSPGEGLALELGLTRDAFAYVFSADESGSLTWLFPTAPSAASPLTTGDHVLPADADGRRRFWRVTGLGDGREHVLLVLAAERLPEMEEWLIDLPRAKSPPGDEAPSVSVPSTALPKNLAELVEAEGRSGPTLGTLRRWLLPYRSRPGVQIEQFLLMRSSGPTAPTPDQGPGELER